MPKKKSEPLEIAAARFHLEVGNFLMALGELIFNVGRAKAAKSERKVRHYIIERMKHDEEYRIDNGRG